MGPLAGIRVLEFQGLGPAPFAGMLLADMGADVILVDRPQPPDTGFMRERRDEAMMRGKRSVTLDLKREGATEAALALAGRADALLEGFRPGVMERLGLGPDACFARNPRLVYGRMTGWGQDGPRAPRAGHDINYVSLTGALNAIGPADRPPPPALNLVGDFGGGGMLLGFGVACALVEAARSGRGQVVDAAMVEGASLLTTMFSGLIAGGRWRESRASNYLDGGAPWYGAYATRDGLYMAVGAIEANFYAEFLKGLGLAGADLPEQHDRARWPELRERFAAAFRTRTRDEWCAVFDGTDACVTPVLSFTEARNEAHNVARGGFVNVGGVEQPAPAPRFSRTPGAVRRPPPARGEGGRNALADWGCTDAEIARLQSLGLGCGAG